jgi:hypothetical protein
MRRPCALGEECPFKDKPQDGMLYLKKLSLCIKLNLESSKEIFMKAMKIPTQVPEKGFYYHYKHDAKGPVNNYAYEVLGVGIHTEDGCVPEDENMVVYRPLYESSVYTAGKFFDIRPLGMFMENVTKGGKTLSRFTKITDSGVVTMLETIRQKMYD